MSMSVSLTAKAGNQAGIFFANISAFADKTSFKGYTKLTANSEILSRRKRKERLFLTLFHFFPQDANIKNKVKLLYIIV